jgi:hypothetical protein
VSLSRFWPFAVTALVAVALGYGVAGQPLVVVGLLGLLGLVAAFVRPYEGALVLIFGGFTVPWLEGAHVLPAGSSLLLDLLALALAGVCLAEALRPGRTRRAPRGTIWLGAFALVTVAGALFGGVSLLGALVSLRGLLRFLPLLFLPVLSGWTDRQGRVVVWSIVGLAVAQAPVAVIQFLTKGTISGDPVGGTIGVNSSGTLTALMIGTMILLAGLYIYRAARGPLLPAAMVAVAIPPALNETKIFFVAAPLLWAVTILPRVRQNRTATVLVVGALLVGFAFSVFMYASSYTSRILTDTGRQDLFQSETVGDFAKDGTLKRVPSIGFAAVNVVRTPQTLVVGYGPGAASTSELTGEKGALALAYGHLIQNNVFLMRIIMEEGFAGLVCWIGLLVSVYLTGRKVERLDGVGIWRGTAMGLQGMVLTFAALAWYNSPFTSPGVACVLWALAGVCALRLARLRESSETDALPAGPVTPGAPGDATATTNAAGDAARAGGSSA